MLTVRRSAPTDAVALTRLHQQIWGGQVVVGHGIAYDLALLPTLVAVRADSDLKGALAYIVAGDGLEIVSIVADPPSTGTGTALLAAAVAIARESELHRVWLVTTNDNLDALRFYQRRGMRVVGVSVGEVDRNRAIKPSIPYIGAYGIPLHDELRLELTLAS